MFGRHRSPVLLVLLVAAAAIVGSNGASAPLPDRLVKQDASDAPQLIDSRADAVEPVQYRLPNNTRPVHYDIELTTNVHSGNFNTTGRVRITLDVLLPQTREIQLHQRQLTIGVVRLTEGGRVVALQPTVEYNNVSELLTVRLAAGAAALAVGTQYVLEVEYSGVLRDDLRGFYYSSYRTDDGVQHWLAGTHFEPTNARHGFPCFDDPGLRATFKVALTHGAGFFAVSNMPVEQR